MDSSNLSDSRTKEVHALLGGAVLEMIDATPQAGTAELGWGVYNLVLNPGECALIECHDPILASAFLDFCTGLVPAGKGTVKCLGLDWAQLAPIQADALRGKLGRTFQVGGWLDLLGTDLNILWPRLHHTSLSIDFLMEMATELSVKFGMPGLPLFTPPRLSRLDSARAQCVRAFLGHPKILLFENPVNLDPADFYNAFMDTLSQAREKGVAIIWI